MIVLCIVLIPIMVNLVVWFQVKDFMFDRTDRKNYSIMRATTSTGNTLYYVMQRVIYCTWVKGWDYANNVYVTDRDYTIKPVSTKDEAETQIDKFIELAKETQEHIVKQEYII